jgi:hypothetical protein
MKHLKTLGLAAMAVLALTAMVGVSSASAAEFHSTNAGNIESAIRNTHKFEVTGSEVTCNTIKFNGAAVANSVNQEVHPEYNNCKAFGFIGAEVNTVGCKYIFNANTNTTNITGCTTHAPPIIVEEKEKENPETGINIHIAGCSLFVPNQSAANPLNEGVINGITYENTGTEAVKNRTLDVKSNSNNIKANVTEANLFGCPLTENGKHNTAKYNSATGIMVSGSAETRIG